MSYLDHLKTVMPGVDWDAEITAARERRDRARRRPWNRLRHWVHLHRHRELHRQACSCKGAP